MNIFDKLSHHVEEEYKWDLLTLASTEYPCCNHYCGAYLDSRCKNFLHTWSRVSLEHFSNVCGHPYPWWSYHGITNLAPLPTIHSYPQWILFSSLCKYINFLSLPSYFIMFLSDSWVGEEVRLYRLEVFDRLLLKFI